ncbi:MAG TPA: hypothetical protein VGB00_07045 [Pyrinomonadaceae bacterium]|jgi:hypothetical protein
MLWKTALTFSGFNENFNRAAYVRIWADRKSYFPLKRENCQWKVWKEWNAAVH